MGAAPRILILDDEVALVDALTRHFRRRGYDLTQTYLVADAVQAIEQSVRDAVPFDAVITDLQLPDGDGRTIVRLAREMLPRCPVVMMTGSRSISGAIDAIRLGAVTVLEKPVAAEVLEKELRQAMSSRADLEKGVDAAAEAGIIGRSPAIRAVLDVLFLAAPTDATVLIEGETGTGKELVAKALHRLSRRARGPLVAVNCAALPETLAESEPLSRGGRRHVVPRRDRRDAAGTASEAAACHPGRRGPAARGRQAAIGRRPPRRCHQPQPRRVGRRGEVPVRSVLSPQRRAPGASSTPRPTRGCGHVGWAFLARNRPEVQRRSDGIPGTLPVAGQRPPDGKRGRAAQGIETGRGLPTSGSAAGDPRRAAAARNPSERGDGRRPLCSAGGPGGPPDPGGPRAEWRKQEPGREVSRPQPHHVGREAAEDVPALSSREITFRVLSR